MAAKKSPDEEARKPLSETARLLKSVAYRLGWQFSEHEGEETTDIKFVGVERSDMESVLHISSRFGLNTDEHAALKAYPHNFDKPKNAPGTTVVDRSKDETGSSLRRQADLN